MSRLKNSKRYSTWINLLFCIVYMFTLGIIYGINIQFNPSPSDIIFNYEEPSIQNDDNNEIGIQDCSCLNDIYDEIFVISIKSRHDTLALTLYQLNQENINYIIWEGHSSNNVHSVELWKQFKQIIDEKNIRKTFYGGIRFSLYYQQNQFFLRQTQVDILKYSLRKNLTKILIFEDDILLANPYWINMFCNIEPILYKQVKWLVINLGTNQGEPEQMRKQLMRIRTKNNTYNQYQEMKTFIKNEKSWGLYGVAISREMFDEYIDIFDFNSKRINVYPMDNHYGFVKHMHMHRTGIKYRCFGIDPPLVLPDVTHSTLRDETNGMETFIKKRSTDPNISHFSKYWKLRFSNQTKLHQSKIALNTPSFEQLTANSPAKLFLQGI